MRSTIMLMGPGVPKGRNLCEIYMRAIAPTLAKAIGVDLSAAELKALDLGR
jgi:hypothetical protein